MVRYDHTYVSYILLVAFALLELILGANLYFSPREPALWIFVVLLIILIINFYSIRVAIDEHWIMIVYGIGMIVRTYEVRAVRSAQLVPNTFVGPWWYAPTAREVVELCFQDGRVAIFASEKSNNIIEMIRSRND